MRPEDLFLDSAGRDDEDRRTFIRNYNLGELRTGGDVVTRPGA